MTTPPAPTSRYFTHPSAEDVLKYYEVRSDGISIAHPLDKTQRPWLVSLTAATATPNIGYEEVDINGTPIKEVNRNNINNELGANVFGRLRVAERALESCRWDDFREEITTHLSFIPVTPTYIYYKGTGPGWMNWYWRYDEGTRKMNVAAIEDGSWTTSGFTLASLLNDEDVKPEQIPFVQFRG